eukprot:TRINITY_DN2329_c0_g2_i1.p1 TRINITY_DN2329_c0_g2~~TRINITY_DN2329_c0_g2_i1.p1  ORF type:complete len:213 (+),score=36.89 TRINITY_DN2329_c0_g2_i1:37-639(+)
MSFYITWTIALLLLVFFHTLSTILWRKLNKKTFFSKTVIITGATSGIGEQLAYQYAKQNSNLLLSGRRIDRLKQVARHCKSLGANQSNYLIGDLSQNSDNKSLIDTAISLYGGIDLLILNAGVNTRHRIEDIPFPPTQEIEDMININLWSCVNLTTLSLPYLRERKGSVALISSDVALEPVAKRSLYAATKRGVQAFLKC